MAVEPKITIARILADINLVVWYGIAIHVYAEYESNRQIFQLYGINWHTELPSLVPIDVKLIVITLITRILRVSGSSSKGRSISSAASSSGSRRT